MIHGISGSKDEDTNVLALEVIDTRMETEIKRRMILIEQRQLGNQKPMVSRDQ